MGGWLGGNPTDFAWSAMLAMRIGFGSLDEKPQDPPSTRQRADRAPLLRGDPGGDELHEVTVLADDAERPVSGVGHLGREVHDPLQDDRQRELGSQGQAGLEQDVLAILRGAHGGEFTPYPPGTFDASGPQQAGSFGPMAGLDAMESLLP